MDEPHWPPSKVIDEAVARGHAVQDKKRARRWGEEEANKDPCPAPWPSAERERDYLSAPGRVNADLRGSEVPDAIGLCYLVSRAKLKRRLQGTVSPIDTAPSDWLAERYRLGHQHESLAAEAFLAHVATDTDGPFVINTTRFKHNYPIAGQTLAATPDMEFAGYTVELKCTQEALPDAPRAVHLAQCLAQMVCANKMSAALLYYQVHTARFRVFWLVGSARIKHELLGWLREFAVKTAEQLRMPPGERDRRAERLLDEMWHFNNTCTAPAWLQPTTTAARIDSQEATPASPGSARCAPAATRPEPGSAPT